MSYYTCYNQTIYPVSLCEVTDKTQCAQMNDAIAITPKFTAMLSMIGVSLIIYRFLTMKPKNRKTYDRLMFGMSIMNFWGSLGFFIGQWSFPTIQPGDASSPLCNWQGWLLQINAAVFWYNGVLATNFILRIRFGWSDDKVKKVEPYMHFVAWFYPVVTSFIALGMNMYGRSGPWCWITVQYDWARWAFFFAELWAIMIYTAICMTIIVITVKKSDDQTAHIRDSHTSGASSTGGGASGKPKKKRMGKKTRQVAIQATLYVATFLLTWIFGTANRIQNAIVASIPGAAYCNVFALVWLHSLFVPAQGFFNFLVYIYPRVQEAERKKKQQERDHGVQPGSAEETKIQRCSRSFRNGVSEAFIVVFGCERLEKSDSHGDSTSRPPEPNRRRRKQGTAEAQPPQLQPPSNGPSGDVPSDHPNTHNEEEESESNEADQEMVKDSTKTTMQEQQINGNGASHPENGTTNGELALN